MVLADLRTVAPGPVCSFWWRKFVVLSYSHWMLLPSFCRTRRWCGGRAAVTPLPEWISGANDWHAANCRPRRTAFHSPFVCSVHLNTLWQAEGQGLSLVGLQLSVLGGLTSHSRSELFGYVRQGMILASWVESRWFQILFYILLAVRRAKSFRNSARYLSRQWRNLGRRWEICIICLLSRLIATECCAPDGRRNWFALRAITVKSSQHII